MTDFFQLDEEGQQDSKKKKSMYDRSHMGKFPAHVRNLENTVQWLIKNVRNALAHVTQSVEHYPMHQEVVC